MPEPEEVYDAVEVLHLIPILQRISENLRPTMIVGRVCGACGCLLAEIDRSCINCEYRLLNQEPSDGERRQGIQQGTAQETVD